jgi:hypothetical protein
MDPEIEAMTALGALDDAARGRVLRWAAERFGEATPVSPALAVAEEPLPKLHYPYFRDLYEAFGPLTDPERALVAAYWLAEVMGAETFQSADLNAELKSIAHGVQNITDAVTSSERRTPPLLALVDKSGETQQSRKTFELTDAGVRAVRARVQESEERIKNSS